MRPEDVETNVPEQNYFVKSAHWDIYTECNLKCMHCSTEGLYDSNNYNYLDEKLAFYLIDKLKDDGINELNILGKEPFLHPHILSILKYACEQGFKVDVTTNGTIIKETGIKSIIKLGLRSIFISIDGSCSHINDAIRGEGTFKKSFHTLQKFSQEKMIQGSSTMINVNTVLTKINGADIVNIIELCSENGVSLFKLSHLLIMGNATENIKKLYIDSNEELEIADQILKMMPKYQHLLFDILSDKPLFLEYFYKKYKIVLPVKLTGCKSCIKEIYIDPMGCIYPCLAASSGFNDIYHNYESNVIDIFDKDYKSISNHSFFNNSRSTFPLIKQIYQNYVSCNSCPYLTTICYPCPLYSKEEIHIEKLCLAVKEKMENL